MSRKTNALRQKFITDYLKENGSIDVLCSDFHDKWAGEFGDKQEFKFFGACPSKNAMRWCKKLYDQGILVRGRVPIHGMPEGFPNWVYVYTLPRIVKRGILLD